MKKTKWKHIKSNEEYYLILLPGAKLYLKGIGAKSILLYTNVQNKKIILTSFNFYPIDGYLKIVDRKGMRK